MPNGTETPSNFWNQIPKEIIESAPLETLLKWFGTAEEKYNLPVPENYPQLAESDLKQWIYTRQIFDQELSETKKQIEIEIPGICTRFKSPYDLLDYLNKSFSFNIRGSDMLPETVILDRCLEYVKSDTFKEIFAANQQQIIDEKEEYRKRARKIIMSGDRLRDNTEKALKALVADNDPPKIFVRGDTLVRVDFDEDGIPIIKTLDANGVKHILERSCDFYRLAKKTIKDTSGKDSVVFEEIAVSPPLDLVKDFIELPTQDFLLPPLHAVIESPAILRSGEVIHERGYNKATKLYYAPKRGLVIKIPNEIKYTDVLDSLSLLSEIFIDFPFDSEASRANCLAALITSVIRPMVKGNVPMVILDKPVAGTGASLIADTISLVSCGRMGNMMTPPSTDEEWKKSITSLLLKGRAVNIVDNIEGRLYAPSLASVITSSIWEDRILGASKTVSLPSVCMWIGTGNNIQLAGDIPRRCYWVRMDPKQARPWQRTGYKHANLTEWVIEKRGEILSAILIITKGWINVGCPAPKKVPLVGSFEDWRIVVGGILEYCGVEHFLENLESMYEQADTDTPQWEAFLEVWYELWKGDPVVLNRVFEHLQAETNSAKMEYTAPVKLVDVLPDNLSDAFTKKKSFVKLLGKALSRHNMRVMPNGLMIMKGATKQHAVQWIVAPKPKDEQVTIT